MKCYINKKGFICDDEEKRKLLCVRDKTEWCGNQCVGFNMMSEKIVQICTGQTHTIVKKEGTTNA